MTLRKVEGWIRRYKKWKFPFGLPASEDKYEQLLDPAMWYNRGTRKIADCFVNSTLRVTTAIPSTLYDLFFSIVDADPDQLRDGLITIPKALTHLVVDTLTIIGVGFLMIGGVGVVVVIIVGAGCWELVKYVYNY